MAMMTLFIRRFPRLSFVIVGAIVSSGCFAFLSHWFTIFNEWLGIAVEYDTRPPCLVTVMFAATWLPWFLLVVVLGLRCWRGPTYKPLPFSLGLAAPYIVVFSMLFLLPILEDRRHRDTFDPQRWKGVQAAGPLRPDRLRMVDDLIGTVPLVGLAKDCVTEILAEGDKPNYWNDWDAVYWLGPERGWLRIDSEWLVLRFSPDGRIREYLS
ncbi:MAG: hypothetical protein EHM80_08900 [Nitrospiraceae bacterium]|nr:MAG: hypothetical protein EHM80_08900 [Nitrospiraceae bacterium]